MSETHENGSTAASRTPGLHDPAAKAAMLKRTNEEMRQRIAELKKELTTERNATKNAHDDKIHKMKALQDSAEVPVLLGTLWFQL
jgi:hypothetical protein